MRARWTVARTDGEDDAAEGHDADADGQDNGTSEEGVDAVGVKDLDDGGDEGRQGE
jgi:hypothetical protein